MGDAVRVRVKKSWHRKTRYSPKILAMSATTVILMDFPIAE